MVIIEKDKHLNMPFLHLVKKVNSSEALPVIFFLHGFTSTKEINLHYGYLLAEEGFRVILPDAIYHGERSSNLSEDELNMNFWEIVINEIYELNILKEELEKQSLIDPSRIGVAGTSMGGIITLGALTQYEWIKSAVSLMGSPHYVAFSKGIIEELKRKHDELPFSEEELEEQYKRLAQYDLSLQPEKLNKRPLLFWHGERDKVVPFRYTYDFYQKMEPFYKGCMENLSFISDANADHKVTFDGVLATVSWFKKHL